MPSRFSRIIPLILILLVTSLTIAPLLLQPGVSATDDGYISIYRIFALRQSWQQGIFYPRFAPTLAFGYGSPLFQYYPPLAAYVGAIFTLMGAGTLLAFKLTFALALLLAGIGCYLYARLLLGREASAWVAVVAYLAAPYALVNIYVRGASAEALALALFPWLLWLFQRLNQATQPYRWLPFASVGVALLLLTHNAQALFFLPLLALFCLLQCWQQVEKNRVGLLSINLLALLLGLGASAFFWLPALLEREYVNLSALSAGYYDPLQHLAPLGELLQRSWAFDYNRPLAFRWGWLPAILATSAILTSPWQQRALRPWLWLFGCLVVGTLALQTPTAAPFWQEVPLVRFIQFPWRLWSFATLGAALLLGAVPLLVASSERSQKRYREWIVAIGLLLGLALFAVIRLPAWYTSELAKERFLAESVGQRDLYERGRVGLELFSDYQPKTVQIAMTEVPNAPAISPLMGAELTLPKLSLQHYHGLSLAAAVTAEVPSVLPLNRFFFPGWQATLDGTPVATYPLGDLGLLAVNVPAGSHQVAIGFGATQVRRWANGVSGVIVLLLCFITVMIYWRKTGWRLLMVLALIIAASLPLMRWFMRQSPVVPSTARIGDHAELLGYRVDQTHYRPGETLQLTLFWRSLQATTQEFKVFVHVRDQSDTQMAGQHDGAPVYGFTPTTRWLPGEVIDDTHPVQLQTDLAPGIYQIAVGMYDPVSVQNLPIRDAQQVLPGERIVLGTIEVLESNAFFR